MGKIKLSKKKRTRDAGLRDTKRYTAGVVATRTALLEKYNGDLPILRPFGFNEEQLLDNLEFSDLLREYAFRDQGCHCDITTTQIMRKIGKSHNIIPDVFLENSKADAVWSRWKNNVVLYKRPKKNSQITIYYIDTQMYRGFDITNGWITTYLTFEFNKRTKTYHFYPNACGGPNKGTKVDQNAEKINMPQYDKAVNEANQMIVNGWKPSMRYTGNNEYTRLLLLGKSDIAHNKTQKKMEQRPIDGNNK